MSGRDGAGCGAGGACQGGGSASAEDGGACSGTESFALRVIGHSMAPEFLDGEIIIVEPGGVAVDGSYVLACPDGEWTFRQLVRTGAGWALRPLDPAWPTRPLLDGLEAVRGVVIQKAVPGRRRASKRYV